MMLERVLLPLQSRRLHGPRWVPYQEDELLAVCLVRNGERFLDSFVQHYLGLGVRHIVFLDNDSTDSTVALASAYPQVSVYATDLPFRGNNRLMRRFLLNRFGRRDRWVLCVDVDELFDYPYSDRISLKSLLGYLTSKSYTTMVSYLLDMVSDKPIRDSNSGRENLKTSHPFYDISAVKKLDYFSEDGYRGDRFVRHNTVTNPEVRRYVGGIRSQAFGLENVYLIKHPLMFCDGKAKLVHQHFVDYASVADLTGVLYHYKFIKGFDHQVRDAVSQKQYASDSYEYRAYHNVLERNPNLCLKYESAKRLESVNQLVGEHFLHITRDYQDWVDQQTK
jgi:glycosyl transferase family 2